MWNAGGLLGRNKSKFDFIKLHMEDDLDFIRIIIITETHFNNSVNDAEITKHFDNYSIVRCDRDFSFDSNSYKTKRGVAVILPADLCVSKVFAKSSGKMKI